MNVHNVWVAAVAAAWSAAVHSCVLVLFYLPALASAPSSTKMAVNVRVGVGIGASN